MYIGKFVKNIIRIKKKALLFNEIRRFWPKMAFFFGFAEDIS